MITLIGYGETFIFFVLIMASIIAVAVGLERTIIYRRNTTKSADLFLVSLFENLRRHDIDAAKKLVTESEDNIYSRFSNFSLLHYSSGHDGLSDLLAGRIIEAKIQLEKRLPILNTLGNNAPFIGLLGTVLGVIKAFHGLGTLGGTGAEVVMRGISSALLATAAGLLVAIPVVMANNYFSRKVKVILHNLEIISKEFMASYSHKRCRSQQ